MTRRRLVTLLLVALAGCAPVSPENPDEAITLCLPAGDRSIPLRAELAVTPDERQKGLSTRSELPRRSGMLFVYPREQGPDNSFWMYQTQIPLTILFLDGQGVIRSIQAMDPCLGESGAECADYPAGVSHWMALEVNQGLPGALDLAKGDAISRAREERRAGCKEPRALTPGELPRAY